MVWRIENCSFLWPYCCCSQYIYIFSSYQDCRTWQRRANCLTCLLSNFQFLSSLLLHLSSFSSAFNQLLAIFLNLLNPSWLELFGTYSGLFSAKNIGAFKICHTLFYRRIWARTSIYNVDIIRYFTPTSYPRWKMTFFLARKLEPQPTADG